VRPPSRHRSPGARLRGDLTVLSGDGDDAPAVEGLHVVPDKPRWTESISTPPVSSASSIAFLIDSTAASRLTTTAPADPPRVREPHPDDVESAVVGHLTDDRGDLGRADVQTHEVAFLSCH